MNLNTKIIALVVFLTTGLALQACATAEKSAARTENDSSHTPNVGERMHSETLDFDTLWNYQDPKGTREKFTALLPTAESNGDLNYLLQLQTQIARTYSLDNGYAKAHEILDRVEHELQKQGQGKPLPLVRVRYLLERGRTFRSSGSTEKALPLFQDSYELAKSIGADFFTVDAAHMMALVVKEAVEKRKWNLIGIEVAEQSTSERARGWLGSLYNNMGWDYHSEKNYPAALDMFERALGFCEAKGDPSRIQIAKWSVARVYRSLSRYDEALKIQLALLKEFESLGKKDGYVFEELGELYLVNNDHINSKKYFSLAYEELSQTAWLMKNEASRMERIKKLAGK